MSTSDASSNVDRVRFEARKQEAIRNYKRTLREKALGDERIDFLERICPSLKRAEIKQTVAAAYPV